MLLQVLLAKILTFPKFIQEREGKTWKRDGYSSAYKRVEKFKNIVAKSINELRSPVWNLAWQAKSFEYRW